ncbi:ParB/RepB/Spo0J family partition protein [Amycolatopsis cihanbeyliensis]|uniref:ParB-like nuclease family protein n=1 Tax=Amycolatopsis cihanbeyliensis TaxID=1128664 RepID=A0A542DF19_AMYCI|nr:ParB/RepB/Spo0J family partition protein [Amycolatopsis cihanbeyliensis]TQJ01662.1 ParB-like nuclease family protein [Amycolatopsis cihanbeyliensis]
MSGEIEGIDMGSISVEGEQSDALVAQVRVGLLCRADSPRQAGESDEHIRALAACGALPPILVHRPTMRVVDGMHRLRAAVLRGDEDIEVRFVDGSVDDAFVLAVKANIAHGLPLSRADRRAAAERIVNTHPEWSDRAIARAVGLSDKTVGVIRRCVTAEFPQSHTSRIGRDGCFRPLDSSEGRRRASELLTRKPGASLREVSAEAGVSTSTVRDVRNRMRRGDDPVVPRQRNAAKRPEGAEAGRAAVRCGVGAPVRGESGSDPASVLRSLRADPSVRFTESGRILLRMLEPSALNADMRRRLVAGVPQHRVDAVAALVKENINMWQEFAEQINQRQRTSA